jgi:signal transduction histidine kinase
MARLWMVVVAVALAILGMGLALRQARTLSARLMQHASQRAGGIAEEARKQLHDQLATSLQSVADTLRTRPDAPWQRPPDWPTWLDGVYTWDGATLNMVSPPSRAAAETSVLVESRIARRPVEPTGGRRPDEPSLVGGQVGGKPIAVGYLRVQDGQDHAIVIAGVIHPLRLRSDLVDPLLTAQDGLALVTADQAWTPWKQPQYAVSQLWVVQPSESFVREQRYSVMGQTLAYVGLTLLALVTLLVAMWFVVRVARRDMALAELKSNFVADVSHELKTPLSVIQLFIETLQSGRITSDEKRREYYSIITRESTRLTTLITNILDFARIDAGRKEYTLLPTDVGEIIRQTYDAYRAQLDHNGFEHSLSIKDGLPRVDADRDAIAQVLINLVTNAIKYSDEERYLGVDIRPDTRRGRRGVLISVEDRGIGIRPEDRPHLADGFFRAADGKVRQKRGAGLGLALVKHIVEAHSGSLAVESRLVKGSTFRVFLPASGQMPGEAKEASSASPPSD